MDLFSSQVEETTVADDFREQITVMLEAVKQLTEEQVQEVHDERYAIERDEWINAVKAFGRFAKRQKLTPQWKEAVLLVRAASKGHLHNAAWDCAYDGAICIMLKPWLSTGISPVHYDLLVAPLRAVGLKSYFA